MLKGKTIEELLQEIESVRDRLQVAEDTLEAIRTGAVDAVAVRGNNGTRIFTLEGADETYRVLVERMSESALTLNSNGIILYCNSQFASLAQLPLNQIIGTSFFNYLPEEFHEKFKSFFDKGWNDVVKGEFVLQTHEENYIHIHMSLNVIESKDTTVLGMIITDLSERKELEKLSEAKQYLDILNVELKDKNKQLTRTNFDLDSFIYTASHDLKAPILNIEGLIATLVTVLEEAGLMKEEIEEILSMMSNSVIRFKETILDLTEITRTQKNFEEDISHLNCMEIIEDVQDSIRSMIISKNVKIKIDTSNCSEIKFSRKNLKSIIYNLLSNAIKYSSPNRQPEVSISAVNRNEFTVLTVMDNGLGIKSEDKTKVFSMFKRLHDHVEGTGVGLYIVKRIVDNAGGKIEVESEVGKGSTFKVYLKNQRL